MLRTVTLAYRWAKPCNRKAAYKEIDYFVDIH